MNASRICAVLCLCLTPSLSAQSAPADSTGDLEGRLASWRGRHGATWEVVADPETGFARFVYGGSAPAPFAPREDADYFSLARLALEDSFALHGIEASTLVERGVSFLPLGNAGSTDKMSVQLEQRVAGVPVLGGYVHALFDLRGNLLSIDSTALPSLASHPTAPGLPANEARRAAAAFFFEDTGVRADALGTPALAIEQVVRDGQRVPELAWRVRASWNEGGEEPASFTYGVSALDGRRVSRRNEVHRDVSGNVQSMLSPGLYPDEPSNPEAAETLPHLDLTSSQGNATTDANGDFTIAGATPPVDVTATYQGPFCQVVNAAGGNHATSALLTQPSGNQMLMNSLSDPLTTAQANAFKWVNRLRDWTRTINPGDSTGDFQVLANVNLPATCNALYIGGTSINFFIEAGGCVNTAFSTVVAHENGHWYNDIYNSGNGDDGFGEGNADVFALYLADSPYNGLDWSGPGTFVRSGLNNRQFCGDCCGGCYGEVHDDGEVLMGALWKVRSRLKNSLGTALGGLTADTLFNSWMNAYNDPAIKTIIRTHWLVLDDDDGNTSNGTPNFGDIEGGFQDQGFPPFVTPCPQPVVYCTAKMTSNGTLPSIGWLGSPTLTANNFHVRMTNAVADKLGLVFYGSAAAAIPFYNGTRCAAQPIKRSPLMTINPFGTLTVDVPIDSSMLGITRWYQFWFRDGGHPDGTGVGLSDGLRVRFCLN